MEDWGSEDCFLLVLFLLIVKIKTMKIILLILLALAFLSCNPEQCTCTTYLNGTEYSVFTADTNCEPSYYSYQVGNQFWEDICD